MCLPICRLGSKPLFQAIALIRIVARIWFLWGLNELYLEEERTTPLHSDSLGFLPRGRAGHTHCTSDGPFTSGDASVEKILCSPVT